MIGTKQYYSRNLHQKTVHANCKKNDRHIKLLFNIFETTVSDVGG